MRAEDRRRATAAPPAFEDPLDSNVLQRVQEAVVLGRLVEEIVGTDHFAFALVLGIGVVGEHEDFRLRHTRRAPHLPDDLDAVALLQADIRDDNVGAGIVDRVHRIAEPQ